MSKDFEEIGSSHPNGLISFNDVISLFIRWKKQLIVLGIAAVVISSVVSFFFLFKY
mgnify:FL=1